MKVKRGLGLRKSQRSDMTWEYLNRTRGVTQLKSSFKNISLHKYLMIDSYILFTMPAELYESLLLDTTLNN